MIPIIQALLEALRAASNINGVSYKVTVEPRLARAGGLAWMVLVDFDRDQLFVTMGSTLDGCSAEALERLPDKLVEAGYSVPESID